MLQEHGRGAWRRVESTPDSGTLGLGAAGEELTLGMWLWVLWPRQLWSHSSTSLHPTRSRELSDRCPQQQGNMEEWSPGGQTLLSQAASARPFPCSDSLARAWMDEMDFAAPNPLISGILNSISQTTGVTGTVIALSGGHAPNRVLEGSVLFIFSCLPLIYTEVHGRHDKATLNTQRNVIAEIQRALLAINPGSLAGAARGEIC